MHWQLISKQYRVYQLHQAISTLMSTQRPERSMGCSRRGRYFSAQRWPILRGIWLVALETISTRCQAWLYFPPIAHSNYFNLLTSEFPSVPMLGSGAGERMSLNVPGRVGASRCRTSRNSLTVLYFPPPKPSWFRQLFPSAAQISLYRAKAIQVPVLP